MEDDTYLDCLEMLGLQLSEVEMLTSMFPNSGELQLDDHTATTYIRQFLDGKIDYNSLHSRIGFTLNLCGEKGTLELVCHFPHEYPAVAPVVFIRARHLDREQHRQISDDLQNYILQLPRGEICVVLIAQWVQEHAVKYFVLDEDNSPSDPGKLKDYHERHFSRMWIYSHHIYSKFKRKDILDFSNELNLTGFLMPGKPGIVVVEGTMSDVEEFWHRLRRMQWKKLTLKEREDFKVVDKDVDECRKFSTFDEKYFEPRQSKGRGAHADRGLLYRFLEEKGFGHVFHLYFGVEGKCSGE